ncbi:ankyrin repeat-containing domain protein [Podospora fimiseda]|uniref:Ankyrin repeat-containing domain protein n=1 Tax=Podospora fimiseda TaxID=252190 RepID=A0AAN6YRH6_9PEZI|nr:ankyrin repeat-containing domain protein [Podospora fimiseda]
MICEIVSDEEICGKGHVRSLPTLHALSLTNRRLQCIVEPILYEVGNDHIDGLPVLWAAHFGLTGCLSKSIAARRIEYLENPFEAKFTRGEWPLIEGFTEAEVAWRTQDPTYWPPEVRGAKQRLRGFTPRDVRRVPTTLQLDVLAPTVIPAVGFSLDGVLSNNDDGSNDDDLDDVSDGRVQTIVRSYFPIHVAVKEGHQNIVKMLLDNKVDIDEFAVNFCGCKPPAGLADELYGWPPVYNFDDGYEWTPLHIAICSARRKIAKLLISRGAKFADIPSISCGFQPIHQVAAQGNLDLLEYMLNKDPTVDINVRDTYGHSPLYYAIINRHWDTTVACLLRHKANINTPTAVEITGGHSMILTPLSEACHAGRFEDALKLIDLGADMLTPIFFTKKAAAHLPDTPSFNAVVPLLHVCCMRPHLSEPPHVTKIAVELSTEQRSFLPQLISKLVSLRDPQDWVSLDTNGDAQMLQPTTVALWHRNLEALKALRNAGVDLLARDLLGRNALMIALSSPPPLPKNELSVFAPKKPAREDQNLYRVLRFLLDSGVNINDKDSDGNTVLHWFFSCYAQENVKEGDNASRLEDKTEIVEPIFRLLLSEGADLFALNEAGHSAIHLIVRSRFAFAMRIIAKDSLSTISSHFKLKDMLLLLYEINPDLKTEDITFAPCGHSHYQTGPWARFYKLSDDIADTILDMDQDQSLTRNPDLLKLCVSHRDQLGNMAKHKPLAKKVWQRGRHTMNTGVVDRHYLLDQVINAGDGDWQMIRQLLDDLPDEEINKPYPGDASTIVYKSVGRLWDRILSDTAQEREEVVRHLIEFRGGDLHLPLPPLLPSKDEDLPTWWMILLQPIRGNPQAEKMLYLHKAVNFPAVVDDPNEKPLRRHRMKNYVAPPRCVPNKDVIRALLDAGADRTELDEDGNTPLSLMLSWLVRHKNAVQHCCEFFRPLSMGVDINRLNSAKRSIASYLEELLLCGDEGDGSYNVASCVMDYLELVRLPNGDREIKWLRG